MADAVTTSTVFNGSKYVALRFTNVSDGSGESAVEKITIANFTKDDGPGVKVAATNFRVMEIQWAIGGFSEVRLLWDATTDDTLDTLSGNGYRNYWDQGGLGNPKSSGWTGKMNLTTVGAAATNRYDIYMVIRLE